MILKRISAMETKTDLESVRDEDCSFSGVGFCVFFCLSVPQIVDTVRMTYYHWSAEVYSSTDIIQGFGQGVCGRLLYSTVPSQLEAGISCCFRSGSAASTEELCPRLSRHP